MKHFTQFSELIIKLALNISAIVLATTAGLAFYQAFTRKVLNNPATWTEPLVIALSVWGVFLVLGPAIRYKKMIPIDAIRALFKPKAQRVFVWITTIATIIYLYVLIRYGWEYMMRYTTQAHPLLPVSYSWLYASMPVGAFIAIFGLFIAHREEMARLNEEIDGEVS